MAANDHFSVYGRMIALPGRRDEVVALIQDAVDAGGSPDLLGYSINIALTDSDTVWVTELWTDRQTHDQTTTSAAVRAVTEQMLALLREPPEGTYGTAIHYR
ncbi:putative quinol monooxygenase [Antrihabitans cavernicola]|uniref:ABM domain-containing protein n=1 Tax=Antrihabitans cavernicola TaxID=2495913 RepID=A0A5A7SJQ5_9NOCA|nr:antibiotic biosynthesis monooxygenase [Spelaeibacter cavernicola]KAA0024883.1 hypothetical protein FOY51_02860 [Spelaeibacter cavernicola]